MRRELEALLFATEAPLNLQRLRAIFPEASGREIREAIAALSAEYDEAEHAFTVVEFGGGWQIATRPEFSPLVEKLMRGKRFARLSRPSLEVLAVVAYRQPVTRMEIEEIRGVQCGGVLGTLLERDLIAVVGRAETVGHPLLYGTTREFLNHLGLRALGQLPDLPDLERVVGDREALKLFAEQVGSELTEEDLARWEEAEESAGGDEDEGDVEGAAEPPATPDEAPLPDAAPAAGPAGDEDERPA